jgi:putative transposase
LKYCQEHKGLMLYEYVMMTNHLHLIAKCSEPYQLSAAISSFKRYTTKVFLEMIEYEKRSYIQWAFKNSFSKKEHAERQIWRRENHAVFLESEFFLIQKANYIHNNPVMKEFVDRPEDWKYSSAKERIIGDAGVLKLEQY